MTSVKDVIVKINERKQINTTSFPASIQFLEIPIKWTKNYFWNFGMSPKNSSVLWIQ